MAAAAALIPVFTSLTACRLVSVSGPCQNYTIRWFYDYQNSMCRQFWYGGCEGNENNFNNRTQCVETCEKALKLQEPTLKESSNSKTAKVKSSQQSIFSKSEDRCTLRPTRGNCRNYTIMWYYRSDSEMCDRFRYGGCGGNANRFNTRQECEDVCLKDEEEADGDVFSIDCGTSEYGCCPDGQTAASGPEMAGCKEIAVSDNGRCQNTHYGCCPDGKTPAQGTKGEGCPSKDLKEKFDPASCGLPKETGSCRQFTIHWYYDSKLGACRQFWYGGCKGNQNRFKDEKECQAACVHVKGPAVCHLPAVTGPCRAAHRRFHYDHKSKSCESFKYGGCKGNGNRFRTRAECEQKCTDSTHEDEENENAEGIVTLCKASTYGCCPDGHTVASGPGNFGCPEPCEKSTYGCCDDGLTAASGPDQDGCMTGSSDIPCDQTTYGCCPDGIAAASGPRHRGCSDVDHTLTTADPSKKTGGDNKCGLLKKRGPCSDYKIKWYYNTTIAECDRFWYGGCEGNENNFETVEECEASCKASTKTEENVCNMPKETGPCRTFLTRWYYESRLGECRTFTYGGCQGNGNNFPSQQNCERTCMVVLTTQPPTTTTVAPRTSISLAGPEEADAGETVRMDCRVTSTSSRRRLDILWYKNNNMIQNNPPAITITRDQSSNSEYSQLTISNSSPSDSGSYTCRETSSGQMRSITVTVKDKRKTETTESDDPAVVCMQPEAAGNCYANMRRWHYDSKSGTCHRFTYGGCRGNQNNFETQAECERFCSSDKICNLGADSGPCEAYLKQYHYDKSTGKCKEFVYGGCQGNPNRFDSLEACNKKCGPLNSGDTKKSADVCQLKRSGGNCDGYEIFWYYDTKYKRCGRFIYTGCGGNGNRFSTQQECEKTCSGTRKDKTEQPRYQTTTPAPPTTTTTPPPRQNPCKLKPKRGPCSNYTIKWFYDTSRGYCNRFYYGGCEGNLNRFHNRKDCEALCVFGRQVETTTTTPYRRPTTTRNPYDCRFTKYGCCEDGVTAAIDASQSNCIIDNEPDVVIRPSDDGSHLLVRPGKNVMLTCTLQRHHFAAVSWYRDGFLLANDSFVTSYPNGTLFLRRMTPEKSGYYACQVNGGNNIPRVQRFRVQTRVPLSILPAPSTIKVKPNHNAFLHCQAFGTPEPRVRWLKNGAPIINGNRFRYFNNGSMIIQQVQQKDAGVFECVAENGVSSARRKITLVMREKVTAKIRKHKGKVKEGDTIQLYCKGSGFPKPKMHWEKDGKRLKDSNRVRMFRDQLLINRISIDDSGMYACIYSNGVERAKDSTTVQVAISEPKDVCRNSLGEKQCMLIVAANLCGHRMFSKMCCVSCAQNSYRYN